MRLVIDAVAGDFGGIGTYLDNLLGRWPQLFPGDEVHVAVAAGRGDSVPAGLHAHELRVRPPLVVGRPVAQTVDLGRLVRAVEADAVLATVPATTVRRLAAPLTVLVHDLRHELRPEQFSRARRAVRAVSYTRSYALADAFVAVSQRTLDDLHRLHPRTAATRATVVHHGADHVLRWSRTDDAPYALAFGHHSNKNVDLVLQAWARLAGTDGVPELRVLGLGEARRAEVAALVASLGLDDRVRLLPYLPRAQFESTMASAGVVVFPSDFEGFGLPVVESMLLGIPIVVGPDPAVLEVGGGHAVVMDGWSASALADAVRRALAVPAAGIEAARAHAAGFTWERTVRQTREALALR